MNIKYLLKYDELKKEVLKDVYQSIHDEALTKCPTCGQEALERIPCGGIAAFMKHRSNTIGSQADKTQLCYKTLCWIRRSL